MSSRTIAALFVGLTLAGSALLGQGSPRNKWWMAPDVKAELGLTDQQSRQVEDVFQAMLPQLRSTKGDLDRLEGELSRMIAEASADESAVLQQIARVEASRSEMSKLRTLMLYRMHRVLSPDQRTKLKALHERDRRGGGNRRPGDRGRY
jgi:Spy/CpxP family protein refolding chaperone